MEDTRPFRYLLAYVQSVQSRRRVLASLWLDDYQLAYHHSQRDHSCTGMYGFITQNTTSLNNLTL